MSAKTVSPVIAAGSRFPVGAEEPVCEDGLSPLERRSFLLRGAEPAGTGWRDAWSRERPGWRERAAYLGGNEVFGLASI